MVHFLHNAMDQVEVNNNVIQQSPPSYRNHELVFLLLSNFLKCAITCENNTKGDDYLIKVAIVKYIICIVVQNSYITFLKMNALAIMSKILD